MRKGMRLRKGMKFGAKLDNASATLVSNKLAMLQLQKHSNSLFELHSVSYTSFIHSP